MHTHSVNTQASLNIQSSRSIIHPVAAWHHSETLNSNSAFIPPPANGPFVYVQQEITRKTHTGQPWFESKNHLYMLHHVLKSPYLIGTPKSITQ